MKYLMGFRNIGRNRRRSMINIFTIGMAIFSIVVFGSIAEGEWVDVVENYVKMGFAHVKIHCAGYTESGSNNLNFLIKDAQSVIEKIRGLEGVESVSPGLKSGGILTFNGKQVAVFIQGVDFKKELKSGIIGSAEGKIPGQGEYRVLVGRKLSEMLNLHPGDIVFLYGRTSYGTTNLIDLEVCGTFTAPLEEFERSVIYVPIDILQEFLGVMGISEISVVLKRGVNPDYISLKIKKELGKDYEVFTIFQYLPALEEIKQFQEGFMSIFWLILLSIVVFGIINIMLISVWERKREIGTLRALGYSRMEVSSIFMLEAAGIGILGGVMGILLGGIVSFLMQKIGIPLSQEVMKGVDFPLSSRLYGVFSFSMLIKGLITSILACLVGSVFPAFRASRLKIIDALREY